MREHIRFQLYFQGNTEAEKMFISENGDFQLQSSVFHAELDGEKQLGHGRSKNHWKSKQERTGRSEKNARQDPFDNKEFFR